MEHTTLSIPGYKVHSVLGSGGMGHVYRATRDTDGLEVAVKVLNGPCLESALLRDRFRAEVEITSAIADNRTVQLIETGLDQGGAFYYVMEFVDGSTIDRYVDRNHLSEKALVSLFVQLCEGVAEVHRIGLIHRDLKPANILITKNGQVKIVDFGLAKFVEEYWGESNWTRAGSMGTPGYVAPESMDGSCPPNIQLDVYSLGVILFQLLTGTTQLAPLRELMPSADRDLEAICAKAVEPIPKERYRTVDALVADLRASQSGGPVSARKLTSWSQFLRSIKLHPKISALCGIAIIAILGAAIGMGIYGTREAEALRKIEARERSRLEQMIQLLSSCDATNLEAIYGEVSPHLTELLPMLQEFEVSLSNDPRRQARISAILLNQGNNPDRIDLVIRAINRQDRLHEVLFLARRLAPYRLELSEAFWKDLLRKKWERNAMLNRSAALAVWDPKSSHWEAIAETLSINAFRRATEGKRGEDVEEIVAAFYPVRLHTHETFRELYLRADDRNTFPGLLFAGMADRDFYREVEAALTSDPEFLSKFPKIRAQPEEAEACLGAIMHYQLRWAGHNLHASQARCAIGLILLKGTRARSWSRLGLSFPARELIIAKMRALGVPPAMLVARIRSRLSNDDPHSMKVEDVSRLSGIVKALATYTRSELALQDLTFMKSFANETRHLPPDTLGKHGKEIQNACSTLLSTWEST